MPGGRLTQHERQRIAQGLAAELPYAEIGRALGRPTSTVTREVLRNGGPLAYRADRAQRAAVHRARRRRAPSPPRPQTAVADAAVRETEAALVDAMLRGGMPTRSMARVLVSLYVADTDSLTSADLVARLGISPASVSKAIAYLEEQRLVRRDRDERRRERYSVDADLWHEALVSGARANDALADAARASADALGPDTVAGLRLRRTARALDVVSASIYRVVEETRATLAGD